MSSKTLLILIMLILSISCSNDTETTKEKTTNANQEKTAQTQQGKVAFYVNDRPVYENTQIMRDYNQAKNDELIYEASLIEKIDEDPAIQKRLAELKKSLVLNTVKGRVIKEYLTNNPVTEDQITEFYNSHIEEFSTLNLLEVSSANKDAIDKLYNTQNNGEDFNKVYDQVIQSGVNINKRELKNTRKYTKLFDKIEIGTISSPKTEGHTHYIYKIIEVQNHPIKHEKNKIKHRIQGNNKRKAVEQYALEVQKKHNIKIKKAE